MSFVSACARAYCRLISTRGLASPPRLNAFIERYGTMDKPSMSPSHLHMELSFENGETSPPKKIHLKLPIEFGPHLKTILRPMIHEWIIACLTKSTEK